MGTISVTKLGKAYKQYPNRWSRLAEWLIPGRPLRHTLKWVLQDVSFTVKPGEAVGIIGINGGKCFVEIVRFDLLLCEGKAVHFYGIEQPIPAPAFGNCFVGVKPHSFVRLYFI